MSTSLPSALALAAVGGAKPPARGSYGSRPERAPTARTHAMSVPRCPQAWMGSIQLAYAAGNGVTELGSALASVSAWELAWAPVSGWARV